MTFRLMFIFKILSIMSAKLLYSYNCDSFQELFFCILTRSNEHIISILVAFLINNLLTLIEILYRFKDMLLINFCIILRCKFSVYSLFSHNSLIYSSTMYWQLYCQYQFQVQGIQVNNSGPYTYTSILEIWRQSTSEVDLIDLKTNTVISQSA